MGYPYSYQTPYQQNYFPVGYQPMYQQGYQQPAPTVQQTQQQSFSPNPSGILWVSGLMEAQAYPLAPNSAVALWEKSGKTIFLKQADATGKPSMTVYDLVERTDSNQNSNNATDEKSVSYAREEDLQTIVGAVKGIDGIIGSMKADIDSLKTDFYGIQGRKRIVKKQETETDE